MRENIRCIAILIHRWIGFIVGVFICIIGLTGSYLVVQDKVIYDHPRSAVEVIPQEQWLPFAQILKAAQQKHPGLAAASILPARLPTQPHNVSMEKVDSSRIDVYINPYTAEIVQEVEVNSNGEVLDPRQSLVDYIYSLHAHLAIPGEWSWKLVGVIGILLVLISLSGLIIYPNWRRLSQGLKVRWKSPWRLVSYDLHKLIGIVSVSFLLLIAVTGIEMTIPFYGDALYALTGSTKVDIWENPPKSAIAQSPPLSIDELIDKAKAALPEGDLSWTYLPTQLDAAFAVDKLRSDESNRWRRSTVFLDQYSGKVLAIHDAYQVSLAKFLNVSTIVLHNGAYGGAFTRILYVFVGLAPTILLITGFVMWRYRRRAKPKSQIVDRPTNQHRD